MNTSATTATAAGEAPAVIPIAASEDGKRNAYTFGCGTMECQMHYASCLGRIAKGSYTFDHRCDNALGGPRCPAGKMREEEVEAGRALYFRERKLGFVATVVEKAKQLLTPASIETLAQEQPKPAAKLAPNGDYMAAALTAAFNDERVAKGRAIVEAAMKPGETFEQAARRLAAMKRA